MLLFEVHVYMYMYCTAGNFSSGENFHHFHHLLLLVIEIHVSAIQKKNNLISGLGGIFLLQKNLAIQYNNYMYVA